MFMENGWLLPLHDKLGTGKIFEKSSVMGKKVFLHHHFIAYDNKNQQLT